MAVQEALDIEVHGIVQGVGFRPFVYKLAKRYLISGWVLNGTEGVFIHAEGEGKLLDSFILEISENAPSAARVDEITIKEVPLADFTTFEIRESYEAPTQRTTLVSPDLCTCDDCVAELFDPANRRYHYPFINCTNCGPRFTIIRRLPYDRGATSMASFPMCPACAHEYANPMDRRFHAQPDACFACGPHISWREGDAALTWGDTLEASDAIIARAAELLRSGGIVAVKGLGGFHLACDASNAEAIAALRSRKRREGKAFAVMMRTVGDVRSACSVNAAEERVLTSPQRPIVLLKKLPDAQCAPGLADHLGELGVMLPSTPLQHLLLAAFGGTLVMTSGNLHDEPIQIDDEEAFRALGGVADAFLGNNRAIVNRFDDSVVRVISAGSAGDALQMVRRARGYAPLALEISAENAADTAEAPRILFACGPEQKNTFCLLRGTEAFVSQHVGDLENEQAFNAWLSAKKSYEELFEAAPRILACDLHPDYLASKWAREQAQRIGAPLIEVQHHHAHIASVLAENGLDEGVIGLAFDGTGYGMDGAIWGGEVLLANRADFERFANFSYVPMPGGAAAIKHPQRMAYGVLWAFDLLDHPAAQPLLAALGDEAALCERMIERGINTPMTSSVGRLFDAASALLGVCTQPLYEGEAAILLEACMYEHAAEIPTDLGKPYAIELVKNAATKDSTAHDTSVVLFDAEPLFRAMLDDMAAGLAAAAIARKFHDAFVQAILQVCLVANNAYEVTVVALSGGVFMNRYLIEHAIDALSSVGFTVAINKDLPPNDGSIAYGQAAIAAKRLDEALEQKE